MSRVRIHPPKQLKGATAFSKTRKMRDPLWLVRELRATPFVIEPLEQAMMFERRSANPAGIGRKRAPGSWPAMVVAFAIADAVDLEPWWEATADELWLAAGFREKPSYALTYKRFTELEPHADHFVAAAGRLIQHAREQDENVGLHVHIDSTEAETHAALVHDCASHLPCMQLTAKQKRRRAGEGERPHRESTDKVRGERQAAVAAAPDEAPDIGMGKVDEVRHGEGFNRFQINGHWFKLLDETAGIRAYTGPRGAIRFWSGFYDQKAIDHYTSGTLAIVTESASRQEYDIHFDLCAQLDRNLGRAPETATYDRGFSIERVFQHNTERGVATIVSRRNTGGAYVRHDRETHDRHGIPRCKCCGGPTRFVRFSPKPKPRLWFQCISCLTGPCAKTQSISCSADWRLLVPLWRTDPIYHELKQSHDHYEAVHNNWRARYNVAPDSLANRPKRRGRGWQQLRAAAAMIAEWLRICIRQGWLGGKKHNQREAKRRGSWKHVGINACNGLGQFRACVGLTAPYGKIAHRLDPSHPAEGPSWTWIRQQQARKAAGAKAAALLDGAPPGS